MHFGKRFHKILTILYLQQIQTVKNGVFSSSGGKIAQSPDSDFADFSGGLNKVKPSVRYAPTSRFLFLLAYKSKLLTPGHEKTRSILYSGLSLVDYTIEPLARRSQISNLLNGIYDIIGLSEILSDTIQGM